MKRFISSTVRVISLFAATAITASIVVAHNMDLADLGAREVIASMPVTLVATDSTHRDIAPPAR